ncbi:hypothetical protein [Syntrophothermus lipocalidus]|uniref:Uncharacterized protein n=1 Tax=Syntrophothermus lipocalidus (strain DSM 12680 / TGB-C1) TaxID=643648 RepID=D7CPY3_SYNLT|nr:hypothetical protein [Syntrophothermus lipocalidus]ADI02761.1 hypothetical protein Slip_2014 [Syntrophothermus lipocalidus DSM 12680]
MITKDKKRLGKSEITAELLAMVLPLTGHDEELDDRIVWGPKGGFKGFEECPLSWIRLPDKHLTNQVIAKNIRHGLHYAYRASNYLSKYYPYPADAWRPTTAYIPYTQEALKILKAYRCNELFKEVRRIFLNEGPQKALDFIISTVSIDE